MLFDTITVIIMIWLAVYLVGEVLDIPSEFIKEWKKCK